tara:strand:+ start:1381 stop:1800 length:420 start_codon:yes stop_codon:yes gene_type:complete
MNIIPKEIFRDYILPFTYCIQPLNLRQDLLSYHKTIKNVKEIYQKKFPTTIETSLEDSDLAWLSNDISRFLNNDQPTMHGIVDFYKIVFQRLYRNQQKSLKYVSIPDCMEDNFNDIKVSIGLMNIDEREKLERFLDEIV